MHQPALPYRVEVPQHRVSFIPYVHYHAVAVIDTKVCNGCKMEKPLSELGKRKERNGAPRHGRMDDACRRRDASCRTVRTLFVSLFEKH